MRAKGISPQASTPGRRRLLRAGLILGSSLLTTVLIWAGMTVYSRALGIRDPLFIHEGELPMFHPDPIAGYRNAPNLSLHAFGTIRLETNERGFRGRREVRMDKPPGVRRLIGTGDSVMWGAGIQEEETFLFRLGEKMKAGGSWEVINAGIIGHSTLQEWLVLERDLLPLKPDLVVINYCENDFVPTEDPFNNVARIHARYFESLLLDPSGEFDALQKEHLWVLIGIFSSPRPRTNLETADAAVRATAVDVLQARPMRRMARAAKASGARFIYVFIPPQEKESWDFQLVRRWQALLIEEGAEWLDVTALFTPPDPLPPVYEKKPGWEPPWRVRLLDNILLQRRIEAVQERNLYIDPHHPSRRGNEIIADQLHRFLAGQPLAEGVLFHRLQVP